MKRKKEDVKIDPEELKEALQGCDGCGWKRQQSVKVVMNGTRQIHVQVKCRAVAEGNRWHPPVPKGQGCGKCNHRQAALATRERDRHKVATAT